MDNHASTSIWVNSITEVKEVGTAIVEVKLGHNTLFFDAKQIEIKVGNNKAKVSIFDFMKAFKDMLDTGFFELNQIDESVWDIEWKLEDLTGRIDYLNAAMREIKGGY